MIAEPLENGLAEDIENGKVSITWNKYVENFHNIYFRGCCLAVLNQSGLSSGT